MNKLPDFLQSKMSLKNKARRDFQKKTWQVFKSVVGIYGLTQFLGRNAFAQNNPSNMNNIQQSLVIAQKNIQDKQKKVLNNEIVPDDRLGFAQSSIEQSIFKLTQSKSLPTISKSIDLSKTNATISDGRRATIIVQSNLPKVTQIAILFDKNPNMMTGIYKLSEGMLPYLEVPIKMRESGTIYILVQSQNQWFMQKKSVQVLLGGCG